MLPRLQSEAAGRGNALPAPSLLLSNAQAGIAALLLGPRPDAALLLPAALAVTKRSLRDMVVDCLGSPGIRYGS